MEIQTCVYGDTDEGTRVLDYMNIEFGVAISRAELRIGSDSSTVCVPQPGTEAVPRAVLYRVYSGHRPCKPVVSSSLFHHDCCQRSALPLAPPYMRNGPFLAVAVFVRSTITVKSHALRLLRTKLRTLLDTFGFWAERQNGAYRTQHAERRQMNAVDT